MSMTNFPVDIWDLHRKVFHRFLKYRKYFFKATKRLPEYKLAQAQDTEVKSEPTPSKPEPVLVGEHVISLLSTSEGEVSEDSGSDSNEEEANVGDV